MTTGFAIILTLVALLIGALLGWLFGARGNGALAAARDAEANGRRDWEQRFARAVQDLEAADKAREAHAIALAEARSGQEADARAHEAQIAALTEARDALSAQFQEVAARLLDRAQAQFLETAGERFKASETAAGTQLAALLQPVHERLQRYEDVVSAVEKERREAYGNLHALMHDMRRGQEEVRDSAANLMNSLRNAPKARGRWGEQQLRNVLESCGLAEHVDFETEVSVQTGDGRLRPDALLRVPGGRSLVIDAKVSFNDYQDAYNAPEAERAALLGRHAAAMRAHVNLLGAKAYQDQFADTADFVIMFIAGEHFLTAALDADPSLWDDAFAKKVLLATPTNLVAIARTVAAVWRQERLEGQAREIAQLGKDLYSRLAVMGGHVGRVGRNLDTAVSAYNSFVGSLESQVLTQARRFETLNVDTGSKQIDAVPSVEQGIRPLAKLIAGDAAATDDLACDDLAPDASGAPPKPHPL